MQQQMAQSKPGSGSCDKPGGKGKPSEGKNGKQGMKDMKQALKDQLDAMKKGSKPGGKQQGQVMSNQQLAKMAAQQAMIRRQVEGLKKKLNSKGKGQGNELNPLLNKLEEQEKALVRKESGDRLIRRQEEILTRLLESEKAVKERGWDDNCLLYTSPSPRDA